MPRKCLYGIFRSHQKHGLSNDQSSAGVRLNVFLWLICCKQWSNILCPYKFVSWIFWHIFLSFKVHIALFCVFVRTRIWLSHMCAKSFDESRLQFMKKSASVKLRKRDFYPFLVLNHSMATDMYVYRFKEHEKIKKASTWD